MHCDVTFHIHIIQSPQAHVSAASSAAKPERPASAQALMGSHARGGSGYAMYSSSLEWCVSVGAGVPAAEGLTAAGPDRACRLAPCRA